MKIITYLFVLSFLFSVFSCNNKKGTEQRYLNPDLPVEKRIDLLMDRMTLREKVGQMCQYTDNQPEEAEKLIKKGLIGSVFNVPGFERMNHLQKLAAQSPHEVPLLMGTDAIHGHGKYGSGSTVYPTPIGLASTYNPQLVKQIGDFTAQEMRATGYHWTFSPNVDVALDPRWGRVGETFGEDPYLVSCMGGSLVKGLQGDNFSESDDVLA